MSIILDAYNVLHCTHILPSKHAMMNVTQLCRLLADSHWQTGRIVVVCDGTRNALDEDVPGNVELIYAGGGRDADSVIERLIADDNAPRDLTVVSNDRRVQSAARRRKAKVLASEDFLRDLVRRKPPRPKGKPQTEADADKWVKEFGLDGDASLPDLPASPNDNQQSSPPSGGGGGSETERWMREFGFDEADD